MMPSSDLVVQTEQLSKIFRVGFWGKRVTAVDGLNLEVRRWGSIRFSRPERRGENHHPQDVDGAHLSDERDKRGCSAGIWAIRRPRPGWDFFPNRPTFTTTSRAGSFLSSTGICSGCGALFWASESTNSWSLSA